MSSLVAHQDRAQSGDSTSSGGTSGRVRNLGAMVLEADAARLQIRAINVDARFQGIQVATQLKEHGLDVREMGQTHAAFAAPMKELERLVKTGKLHHGGNPILRWAIDHLVVDVDSYGDVKPNKSRAHEKIDPVVAVVMALDLAIRHAERAPADYQLFIFGRGR